MATSGQPGPLSIVGLQPPFRGPTPYIGGPAASGVPDNSDFSPSLLWCGFGVRDPRYLSRVGQGPLSAGGYANQDCGWLWGGPGIITVDQAPAAAVANNIALSQSISLGAALSLTAGAGVAVLAAPLTILPTGNVIPKGALVIDGSPTYTGGGPSGAFQFMSPSTSISRALVVAGTGANVTLRGMDVYGAPLTQTLGAAGTTTKAFKFLVSATGNGTGSTVTIGTTDVIGLPLYAPQWAGLSIYWGTAPAVLQTAATGFVAGVVTTPSAITGDTRGTYLLQTSASDGTRKLTVYQPMNFGVIASTYAAVLAQLVGLPQF